MPKVQGAQRARQQIMLAEHVLSSRCPQFKVRQQGPEFACDHYIIVCMCVITALMTLGESVSYVSSVHTCDHIVRRPWMVAVAKWLRNRNRFIRSGTSCGLLGDVTT